VALVVTVKQYRYRDTAISISGNSDGSWQGAIALPKSASAGDFARAVCETPSFDSETLALSGAVELVEYWLNGGAQ
jgi:hypothetical protein